MSDRSHYILIQKKKVQIYYDRWCMGAISSWLLSNPKKAIADLHFFMSSNREFIYDENWCDNAVLIDVDSKVLKFFLSPRAYGWTLNYPLIKAVILLAQENWSGWTVNWAYRGIAEIAEYIGIDPKSVIPEQNLEFEIIDITEFISYSEPDPRIIDLDTGELIYVEPRYIESFITVRDVNGFINDFCYHWELQQILLIGPQLLSIFPGKQATHVLPSEALRYKSIEPKDSIKSGVYIDEVDKQLTIWWEEPRERQYFLKHLSQCWADWSIKQQFGGLEQQFELSNRSLQGLTMSQEQAKELLMSHFKN